MDPLHPMPSQAGLARSAYSSCLYRPLFRIRSLVNLAYRGPVWLLTALETNFCGPYYSFDSEFNHNMVFSTYHFLENGLVDTPLWYPG